MSIHVRRHRFETTDAGEAHAFVAAAYSRYEPRRQLPGPVRFQVRRAAFDGVAVDHLVNENMASSVRLAPFESLSVCTFASGHASFRTGPGRAGATEVLAGPGEGFLYPVGQELTCDWDDPDGVFLTLPLDEVRRAGSRRCGIPAEHVRFPSGLPLPGAGARRWALTQRHFAQSMLDPEPGGDSPLLLREQRNLLVEALLDCFPNSTMSTGHPPGPGAAGPATTRRALQFIEANASLPITVEDIAQAARVDARSLQAAFRRHLGTSPVEHLRWTRLHAAHADLQATGPELGLPVDVPAHVDPVAGVVAAVARRWGFLSTSGFVAAYREEFGTAPDDTVRS